MEIVFGMFMGPAIYLLIRISSDLGRIADALEKSNPQR